MTGEIKAIDRTTVHRICSGQVVLNLAIAVKELVENSLDAGATVIDVKLKEYGSELVEVTDNGSGVHPSNFKGLTLKHHTSKLRDFSDLISVETFGFRGEALSSLCALSELSVITRHESEECGTNLVFDRNGHISGCKPHARQMGTTVVLSNLFSSLPVRQKEFHRNLKKDFNKMTQLLYAYCLVSTGVRINCSNQAKKGVRTTFMATQGCKTVKENISCIFGAKQLNNLLEITTKQPLLEVIEELKLTIEDCKLFNLEGWISSCAHGAGRSTNDRQFYYINSRPCEPSKVIKTVNEVYHQYNSHQYPFVFLNVKVSRDSVDVNVTPDKRQIFLAQEKLLSAIIKASLTDLFEKIPSTYSLNNTNSDKGNSNLKEWRQSPKDQTPNFSRFNLWRHKSDGKRSCDSESDGGMRKQMKTESKQNVSSQKTLETFKIQILHPDQTSKEENDHGKTDSALINNSISNVNEENCNTEDVIKICSDDVVKHPQAEFKESDEIVEREESFVNIELNDSDDDELIVMKPTLGGNESELNEADGSVEENVLIEEEPEVSSKLHSLEEEKKTCVLSEESPIPVEFDIYEERGIKCIETHINLETIKNSLTKRISQCDSSFNCISVKFHAVIDPTKNELAEKELNREISKDMFGKMEIIGQFNLGFIITKLGSDLFIIDQHASDEKYNFETLQKTTTISNQKLVVPQTLELTAANEYVLMDNMNVFKKNGFDFKIDESAPPTKRICLTALPMSRNWIFGKEDIDELIFMLQDCPGADCRPSRVRAMFASRACRQSVMIGTSLNKTEMRRLVNNMSTIEQPWNCPHGRPTMRHLVNLDLIT